LKFPPNAKIPPHYHSLPEHVTVLSGTFRVGHGEKYDDKLMTGFGPGSFAVVPAKVPHFGMAEGETIIQVHGMGPFDLFFVDPKDEPTKKN
jgi:quercetin dioxygenase-like cupin family protein